MRHKRLGRKLGVVTKHRRAMLRNMVTDLLRHERIKTTDTRAKELRRAAEKIITLAKQGTLHARRSAAGFIRDKEVLKRLFGEIAEKYKDRPGGYTRIIKLGIRRGDNAPISMIELVEEEIKSKRKKKPKTASPEQKSIEGSSDAAETAGSKSQKKEAAEELGLSSVAEKEKSEEPLQQQEDNTAKPEPEKDPKES